MIQAVSKRPRAQGPGGEGVSILSGTGMKMPSKVELTLAFWNIDDHDACVLEA